MKQLGLGWPLVQGLVPPAGPFFAAVKYTVLLLQDPVSSPKTIRKGGDVEFYFRSD